jgi:hypothetical protein
MTKALRDQLRSSILEGMHGDRILTTLSGQEIEIRSPSLADIVELQQEDNRAVSFARMLIAYAYVPGTDERLFDPEDEAEILKMPFNEELRKLTNAMNKMLGVDSDEEDDSVAGGNSAEAQSS